jgi:fatty-acyl-CoA synthase
MRNSAMQDWYEKRRLGDLPTRMAARFASREALVFGAERYTFAEVDRRIDAAAKALIALGISGGDHVSLWLVNRPDWLFISFALARIGAVQVPVNTRFRTHDLAYVLGQSDSTALITHDVSGPIDYCGMVREVVDLPAQGTQIDDPRYPALRRLIILGAGETTGATRWQSALETGRTVSDTVLRTRQSAVDPDAPALIMYTSGTTGIPKGVVHSHRIIRNVEERAYRMAITERDTILNYLPLFHAFAFSEAALMSMSTGARQILMESFDPDHALDLVSRERVTILHGFEAHMQGLCDAQESRPRDLSSLRTGLFAAGTYSATPVVQRGARVLAPLKSLSAFGMTETWLGATVSALDDDAVHRLERSGYPALGYEVRVVEPDTEKELPRGTAGELRVRGYGLMLGYYKMPQDTSKAYDADGWFITGDMAEHHADGHIRFLGRYKDMLKVGGENVDPMEVEGFLLQLPDIHQAAVVAYPDSRLVEVPVAFVVLKPGRTLAAAEIIDNCRGRMAGFKIPRSVLLVDALPMTASGKIQKAVLRKRALREIANA